MAQGQIAIGAGDDKFVIPQIPTGIMQALYYEATQRTEKISKTIEKNVLIKLNDIEHLCHLMSQVSQQFDITGNSEIIIVNHLSQDKIRFSSLAKFSEYNTKTPYPIENIIIQWKFLLKTAQVGKYHEYQIAINVHSLVLKEFEEEINNLRFLSALSGMAPIQYSIDYVDYVVARSFTQAFDEWEKTLSIRKVDALVSFYLRHEGAISKYVKIACTVTPVCATYYIFKICVNAIDAAFRIPAWISITLIFSVLMYAIADLSISLFGRQLLALNRSAIIIINKGDEENYNRILSKEQKSPKRMLL